MGDVFDSSQGGSLSYKSLQGVRKLHAGVRDAMESKLKGSNPDLEN